MAVPDVLACIAAAPEVPADATIVGAAVAVVAAGFAVAAARLSSPFGWHAAIAGRDISARARKKRDRIDSSPSGENWKQETEN